jgi:hypothetical protein
MDVRREGIFVLNYEVYAREMSTMMSTVEREVPLSEFVREVAGAPIGPGTVGVVVLPDADEWAAPLVLAAAADCDGVHVFVARAEDVAAVAAWVAHLPHAERIRVHAARHFVNTMPSLAELKELRAIVGPALGITHAYVPAGIGFGWRRWLESGQVDEPPINVVEVVLPQAAMPLESLVGVAR